MGSADDQERKKATQREQGRRLKAAREQWGHATPTEAARFYKFNTTTYLQHENGTRPIGKKAVEEYAQKLGVDEAWILWGKNPPYWAVQEIAQDGAAPVETHFLREWREHRRITLDRLADELGVPSDILQQWEAGRLEVSDKWLRKIAKLLGTTPGTIMDVDPGAVAPSVLDIWTETAEKQQDTRKKVTALRRTGTDN